MNKIKELRKEDNITVAELANIEAGNRNIKATDLKIIKELLGVSYQEFLQVSKMILNHYRSYNLTEPK